jgi:hypothetical protein
MTAATVAKVIGPCKRAPRRRLDPSRLEYDRERHSALRGNAVARSHANSASLVHADVFGPIGLLHQTISREQPSGTYDKLVELVELPRYPSIAVPTRRSPEFAPPLCFHHRSSWDAQVDFMGACVVHYRQLADHEQDLRIDLRVHKHCFASRQSNVTSGTAELGVKALDYGARRSRPKNLYYTSGSQAP